MKPKIEINDNKIKIITPQNKILDWLTKQNSKKIVKKLQKQGIIDKGIILQNIGRTTQTINIIIDEEKTNVKD